MVTTVAKPELQELERLEAQRGAPLPFLPAQAAPWWPQADGKA